jgi:hypothetical protein
MRYFKLYFTILFIVLGTIAKAQTTNHQVYALFVVNIAKYSLWPTHNGEMKITIFGKTKVYDELMKQDGKPANGVLKINQTDDLSAIGTPNIIYLADGKSGALDDLLKAIEGKSIMIITEREGLFKKGAGFSFVILENNTLRFDINNTDLEKRQIKISKNLAALSNSTI